MQKNYKTQIEQKERAFTELKKNYNLQMKDNEKVIEFIIEQLKYMEKCIDNNNIDYNSNESSSPYLSQKANSLQFGLIKVRLILLPLKAIFTKSKCNSKKVNILKTKQKQQNKVKNRVYAYSGYPLFYVCNHP